MMTKQDREDRACDCIIACLMAGKTSKRFWNKVYKKVDQIERVKKASDKAKHSKIKFTP